MASATETPEVGERLILKPEDREVEGESDFDSPRAALDRTLERLATAETVALQRELGYSCEWWLPN